MGSFLFSYLILVWSLMLLLRHVENSFGLKKVVFYDFNKIPLNKGDTLALNNILLVNCNGYITLGKPYLSDEYKIEATVLRHISGPKIRVYKMRPKKKTRKT